MNKRLLQKPGSVALFIIAVAVMLVMAACTSGNNGTGSTETPASTPSSTPSKTEQPAPSQPEEAPVITFMMRFPSSFPASKDLYIFKKWGETANAVIEPQVIPDDVYKTKVVSTIASGDLPDIMNPKAFEDTTNEIAHTYGPRGLFVKLNEHWDKLPNLKRYLDDPKYSDFAKSLVSPDGNVYMVPTINEIPQPNGFIEMRGDLLEKQGIDYKTINTLDDLTNALRALKEANEGRAPLSFRSGYEYLIRSTTMHFGTSNSVYFDSEQKKFVYGPLTKNYKIFIDTFRSWYEEGLLHQDYLNMEDQVLEQMYRRGEIAALMDCYCWNISEDVPGSKTVAVQNPIIDGVRTKTPLGGNLHAFYPWVINAKTEHLDTILKLVDYMFSEEGKVFGIIGMEGETWEKDANSLWGGTLLFKAWIYNADRDDVQSYTDLGLLNSMHDRIKPEEFGPGFSTLSTGTNYLAEAIEFLDQGGSLSAPAPSIVFTAEEQDELNRIMTPLQTFVDENTNQFLLMNKSMNDWDGFISQVNGMNPQRVVDIYNSALERYYSVQLP